MRWFKKASFRQGDLMCSASEKWGMRLYYKFKRVNISEQNMISHFAQLVTCLGATCVSNEILKFVATFWHAVFQVQQFCLGMQIVKDYLYIKFSEKWFKCFARHRRRLQCRPRLYQFPWISAGFIPNYKQLEFHFHH